MSSETELNSSKDERAPFFEALVGEIMRGAMIPKVQLERSISPLIGFFLPEAVCPLLGDDIVMLCPEFPIRKTRLDASDNNSSTNIDWLLLDCATNELIFLELKTNDTTFSHEQFGTYRALLETIQKEGSAEFLLDEIQSIKQASKQTEKYEIALEYMGERSEKSDEELQQAFRLCKRARVVYLAPRTCKPKTWNDADPAYTWIDFATLPETLKDHAYAVQWPTLREALCKLDDGTPYRGKGEGSRHNYSYRCSYTELIEKCRVRGSSLEIGLIAWRKSLPQKTEAELASINFKVHDKEKPVGKGRRIPGNWIPGDEFLKQISSRFSFN